MRQSARLALYDAAADRLRAEGRLYPCWETADELDRKRKRQQARGLPPVYDRAALALTSEERQKLEAEGRRPHWRFLLERTEVAWHDLVRGECRIDCASLSDPVLVREDGSYLYTPTSVADDVDLGVSHVIRGEDHVTNTAVQLQIFAALGAPAPVFAHHNLLTTTTGEGLSKRSGALSIGGLREAGIEPMAVAALAVLVGTSEAVQPIESLDGLAALADLSHVSRNAAKFDPAELVNLSQRTLHLMPYGSAAARLTAAGIGQGEAFWLAVRGNLERFDDVAIWHAVTAGEIEPVREDRALLDKAASLLPPEPWGVGTWSAWTGALKAKTGAKGRALFHPLRLALTGRETGPELAAMLPLMGRARVLERLGVGR